MAFIVPTPAPRVSCPVSEVPRFVCAAEGPRSEQYVPRRVMLAAAVSAVAAAAAGTLNPQSVSAIGVPSLPTMPTMPSVPSMPSIPSMPPMPEVSGGGLNQPAGISELEGEDSDAADALMKRLEARAAKAKAAASSQN